MAVILGWVAVWAPGVIRGVRVGLLVPEGEAAIPVAPLHLALGHRVPAEVELPVEAAPRHVRPSDVLKRVVTDDVDDGAHNGRPEAHDAVTQ